jgi:hypothetical protein
MNKLALVALVCATALPIAAQTKVLVATSRVSSSVASNGNFALPTACDEQGHLYVRQNISGGKMTGPLLRLSGKGTLEAEFDTSGTVGNVFALRPNGGVAMVRLDGATNVVYNFGPDGKLESSIRLNVRRSPFSLRR